jgi:hypothetical protein
MPNKKKTNYSNESSGEFAKPLSSINLPSIFSSNVIEIKGNEVSLNAYNEVCKAVLTDGCLLRPNVGDNVLSMQDEKGDIYVISVIAKANSDQERVLDLGHNSVIKSDSLVLDVKNKLDINTVLLNETSTICKQVSSDFTNISSKSFVYSKESVFDFGKLKGTVGVMNTTINTLTQTIGTLMKKIIHFENSSVGSKVEVVENGLIMNSRSAKITTKYDLHLNGKNILMN